MTVELLPLGTRCNLKCRYCYQAPTRDQQTSLGCDVDRMLEASLDLDQPLVAFGGEPLLTPVETLESIWAASFEKYGEGAIQTNGVLINEKHISLFKRYNVRVGVSVDGPGALNDARWAGSLQRTRKYTRKTHENMALLLDRGITPALIVTLHKLNASSERLPELVDWLNMCANAGIQSVRLHLLERDGVYAKRKLAMTAEENTNALLTVYDAAKEGFPELDIDVFADIRRLLTGADHVNMTCCFRGCDAYATPSCHKVTPQGEVGGCLRTVKDGKSYKRAVDTAFERSRLLYEVSQAENGCRECRWFIFCRGHCPGSAIDGDWRNRSADCTVYKNLFSRIEEEIEEWGERPVSKHPDLKQLELDLIDCLTNGWAPSIWQLLDRLSKAINGSMALSVPFGARESQGDDRNSDWIRTHSREGNTVRIIKPFVRCAWIGGGAEDLWRPRLDRIRHAVQQIKWHRVVEGVVTCASCAFTLQELHRECSKWVKQDLNWIITHLEVRLNGSCVQALIGPADVLKALQEVESPETLLSLLGWPECCARRFLAHLETGNAYTVWESFASSDSSLKSREINVEKASLLNPLFVPLEVRAIPHLACSLECEASLELADSFLELGRRLGYVEECKWIEDVLTWPVHWSGLQGIGEARTPVMRFMHDSPGNHVKRVINYRAAECSDLGVVPHGNQF